MILKIRDELRGGHVHVDFFIGPDADHLAKSGTLVFNVREWHLVGLMLAYGAAHIGDMGISLVGLDILPATGPT